MKNPRTAKSNKALDREIERLYQQHAAGMQIDVMDIGKVFAAGQAAAAAGLSVEDAVKTAIGTYCRAA